MTARRERHAILYLASTITALVMIKVLIFDGCYAFDTNDDVNHTFVNLHAARESLRHGALPNINLYNNFGTPLLGDALTFPFALQSLTYWVLPPYAAMTLNRALITFLTVGALCVFLRRFLSLRSTLVSAVIVILSPGFFWNLAHHHYQLSLLCFAALLYAQSRWRDLGPRAFVLCLSLGYTVFLLSVSIQPVAVAVPFLLLYLPVTDGKRALRAAGMNTLALAAALMATGPHTAAFFRNIAGSTRVQWSPYSGILSTAREQVLALIVPPGEWMHYGINGHFSVATYYSIAYLLFAAVGILVLFRTSDDGPRLLRTSLVLGVLPAAAGYVLQFYGNQIPFVQAVDSTRVWWFSNLFIVIAVGALLDAEWSGLFGRVPRLAIALAGIGVAGVAILIGRVIPEFGHLAPLHLVVIWGTVIGVVAVAVLSDRGVGPVVSLAKHWIVGVILLAQVPTLVTVMALNRRSCAVGNHYFAYARDATFQPSRLLAAMEPGYRMASEESPVQGHDLKAIFGHVLGSNARAIVSSQVLMDILLRWKMVTPDANYYFSPPWRTDLLSRLGIRYLMTGAPSRDLERDGWTLIATDAGRWLYDNPDKPTLVHIARAGQRAFVTSYQLIPNGIRIDLPEQTGPGTLVVSCFYREDWHATVDGAPVTPTMNELGMMAIPIARESRNVLLKYTGVTGLEFALSFAAALAVLTAAGFTVRRQSRGFDAST